MHQPTSATWDMESRPTSAVEWIPTHPELGPTFSLEPSFPLFLNRHHRKEILEKAVRDEFKYHVVLAAELSLMDATAITYPSPRPRGIPHRPIFS